MRAWRARWFRVYGLGARATGGFGFCGRVGVLLSRRAFIQNRSPRSSACVCAILPLRLHGPRPDGASWSLALPAEAQLLPARPPAVHCPAPPPVPSVWPRSLHRPLRPRRPIATPLPVISSPMPSA